MTPADDTAAPILVCDDHEVTLSGVAVCAGCGRSMVGSRSAGVRVYRCKYGQTTEAKCEAPAVLAADRLEGYARKMLRRVWVTGGFTTSDDPPEGTGASQETLAEAEAELYAFATDPTLRKALGGRYHDALAEAYCGGRCRTGRLPSARPGRCPEHADHPSRASRRRLPRGTAGAARGCLQQDRGHPWP